MCLIEVFEAQSDFISIINQYLKKTNWIGIRMLINKSWLLCRQIKFFGKYMEKQWYKKNILYNNNYNNDNNNYYYYDNNNYMTFSYFCKHFG